MSFQHQDKIKRSSSLLLSVAIIWVWFLSASHPPASADPGIRVASRSDVAEKYVFPFQYDPILMPGIVLYVSIDGSVPLPFVLDTGSRESIISPWAMKKLGIKPSGESVLDEEGLKRASVSVQQVALPIGPDPRRAARLVPFKPGAFSTVESPFLDHLITGVHVAGILGIAPFRDMTLQFDFAEKTLTVYPLMQTPWNLAGAAMLPLSEEMGRYRVRLQPIGQTPVESLLDTGIPITRISREAERPLKAQPTIYQESYQTLSGSQTATVGLLSSLPLATLSLVDVEIYLTGKRRGADPEVLLGLNALSQFRITLDLHNLQMHLQPRSDASSRRSTAVMPMASLSRRDTGYAIDSVTPGSAPYRAGLRGGDRILTVDQVALDALEPEAAIRLFHGYADFQAYIVFERLGQKYQVTYPRYSLALVAGNPVSVGMSLNWKQESTIQVTGVDTRSPARGAGLRSGDQILEINGLPVAQTDRERLLGILSHASEHQITFLVQSPGDAQPRAIKIVFP